MYRLHARSYPFARRTTGMMTHMRQFDRQRIRLPLERYADQGSTWHVSMVSLGRRLVLTKPSLGADLIACLRTTCTNGSARLLVYCLMPNHLHALIQIEEDDLIAIVRNFKSFSTKLWWKHGGEGKLWQRSAYDRGVRIPERMDDLLKYIFENPLEVNEIESWIERGWLGGTLLEAETP